MRDEILSNINNPGQLEKLYRVNRAEFKQQFSSIYPKLIDNKLAGFWYERLKYEPDAIAWGSKKDLRFVAIASLAAGFFAKMPAILPISEEIFYQRNVGFLAFPFLAAYFAWKNQLAINKIGLLGGVIVACLVYINLLPNTNGSDTFLLACIHLPLLLWAVLGVSFSGNELGNYKKRLSFLSFNGDLVVMAALLALAGVLMSGITIGLFSLIGWKIEKFYFEYVVVFGLPAVPIVATYLTQTNPRLVNMVSPAIANIFSPLVLAMLIIYLGAIIFSGKDLFYDREFLLLFNLLLIGVMALIFFSIAESSANEKSVSGKWVLLLLSTVTVVVNGIALSVILFRIAEWGITPNRIAVFGGNILMLAHLLIVTVTLFKAATKKVPLAEAGKSIVLYLPVYVIWAMVVVFLFPLFFGFK